MKDVITFYYWATRGGIKIFVLILVLIFTLCMLILCFPFLWLGFVRKYIDKLAGAIQDVFDW